MAEYFKTDIKKLQDIHRYLTLFYVIALQPIIISLGIL